MNQKKVIVTVGRHGIYDEIYGIMPFSMLDAYFSAKRLKTFGKALILSSPLERAAVTAKIRREVLDCKLEIVDGLSQNNFFSIKPAEYKQRKQELYAEIFNLIRKDDYEHVHILTHMPVMDILHLPMCNECEYIVIEAPDWNAMKELLAMDKIPFQRGLSGRQDALDFLNRNDDFRDFNYSEFLTFMKKRDK